MAGPLLGNPLPAGTGWSSHGGAGWGGRVSWQLRVQVSAGPSKLGPLSQQEPPDWVGSSLTLPPATGVLATKHDLGGHGVNLRNLHCAHRQKGCTCHPLAISDSPSNRGSILLGCPAARSSMGGLESPRRCFLTRWAHHAPSRHGTKFHTIRFINWLYKK